MLNHKALPWLLLIYHFLWAVVGYYYILSEGGDATKYWWMGSDLEKVSWTEVLQPGTELVKGITYPFIKFLKLPF